MCCGRGAGAAGAGSGQSRAYVVEIGAKEVHRADTLPEAKIWIAQNAKGSLATVRAVSVK